MEKVYGYDPLAGMPEEHHHHVLGAQCQLWTEYIATPAAAEYQYFPRLCAFAETVWSPPPADGGPRRYGEFRPRLAHHLGRLAALGVNFRPLDGPTQVGSASGVGRQAPDTGPAGYLTPAQPGT